jgi:membrane protease YdiL (CAAX protease family)
MEKMILSRLEWPSDRPFGVGIDTVWRDVAIAVGAALLLILLKMVSPLFTLGMPVALGDTQTFTVNVIMASFGEESFFRGILPLIVMKILYFAKLYSLGNFWVVNLIQSVCFSLFHWAAYGVGYQTAFIGAGSIGFIFGILVAMTHSLVTSIIPHMGLNGSNYVINNQVFSLGGV